MMSWRSKSYDLLPALKVRRQELRHSLRLVTMAWMFGVVWISIINGDQMRIFCKMLGFDDFTFGLMSAVGFLATFGQVVAAVIVERTGLRKYQFLDLGVIHRLVWLAIAAVPLLIGASDLPSKNAVALMLALLGLTGFLGAMAGAAWLTWMGDLIPRRIRGQYFASREKWSRIPGIATVIVVSVVLELVSNSKLVETAAAQPILMWTICIMFAVAAIFGCVDILLFRRIREILPSYKDEPRAPVLGLHELFVSPFKNKVFRNYVLFGAMLAFAMSSGGWYYWRCARETMHFSALGANVLFMVIGPIAGALTLNLWGKLIDRWGRRPTLIVATLGTIVSALPWFVMRSDMRLPAGFDQGINWLAMQVGGLFGHGDWHLITPDTPTVAYLLAGAASILGNSTWTAVGLAQNTIVLGFADGQGRSKYVAASAVFISVGGIAGGVLGGLMVQHLEALQLHPIGPFEWNNWHAAFLLSMLARVPAMIALMNMPDPGARTVMGLLRYMGEGVYMNVTQRLFYPLRLFGWDRGSGSGQFRARGGAELGSQDASGSRLPRTGAGSEDKE